MFDIKFTLFSLNFPISHDKPASQKTSGILESPLFLNGTMQLIEHNNGKFKYVEDKFNKHYQAYSEQMAIYDSIPATDFPAKLEQLNRANEELLQMCKWAEETIPINQEFIKLHHRISRACFPRLLDKFNI